MNNEGIIFAAGGLKGAFQVGALSTILMDNPDYNPRVLAGISTGALTASVLAQSLYGNFSSLVYRFSQLSQIYGDLDGPLGKARFPGGYVGMGRGIAFHGSIETPNGLIKLLADYVSPEDLKASGREFRCGTVNLNTGRYETITQNTSNIRDFILASATIPVVWPPVWIGGAPYIDGGARNMFPLRDAISTLKEKTPASQELNIKIILTNPIGIRSVLHNKKPSTLSILGRTVDILMHQIIVADFKELIFKNKLAKLGHPQYRYINLEVVFPDQYYDTSLTAEPQLIRRMVNDGMKRAKNPIGVDRLEEILKEGQYV